MSTFVKTLTKEEIDKLQIKTMKLRHEGNIICLDIVTWKNEKIFGYIQNLVLMQE